jgi:hypothetical protein
MQLDLIADYQVAIPPGFQCGGNQDPKVACTTNSGFSSNKTLSASVPVNHTIVDIRVAVENALYDSVCYPTIFLSYRDF